MEEIVLILQRQMHASVYAQMDEDLGSPLLAGRVNPRFPKSIFTVDPHQVLTLSRHTSKLRLVWVCRQDLYTDAMALARQGEPMEIVRATGHLSIVAAQTFDGGMLRIMTKHPWNEEKKWS